MCQCIQLLFFSNAATLKFKEPFQTAQVIQNKQLKRTIKRYNTPLISTEQLIYMTQLLESLVPTSSNQKRHIKNNHLQHVKEVSSGVKKKSKRTESKRSNNHAAKDKLTNVKKSKVKSPSEKTETSLYSEAVAIAVLDKQIDTMEEKSTTKISPEKDSASITNICPKCGGNLTMRQGKFGAFYGCQSFPKCRFTKQI